MTPEQFRHSWLEMGRTKLFAAKVVDNVRLPESAKMFLKHGGIPERTSRQMSISNIVPNLPLLSDVESHYDASLDSNNVLRVFAVLKDTHMPQMTGYRCISEDGKVFAALKAAPSNSIACVKCQPRFTDHAAELEILLVENGHRW